MKSECDKSGEQKLGGNFIVHSYYWKQGEYTVNENMFLSNEMICNFTVK